MYIEHIYIFLVLISVFPSKGIEMSSSTDSHSTGYLSDEKYENQQEEDHYNIRTSPSTYYEKETIAQTSVSVLPEEMQMVADEPRIEWTPLCACKNQHEVIDLGDGHYPRYLTTVKCIVKSCTNRFYQCRHYHYKVHVLVDRGIAKNADYLKFSTDSYVNELTLPDSIGTNWRFIQLSIPVTCIAVEMSS